jgi:hypothetical protein
MQAGIQSWAQKESRSENFGFFYCIINRLQVETPSRKAGCPNVLYHLDFKSILKIFYSPGAQRKQEINQ